jgi:drug/metabolite transporter (DMT)-like permease
MLLATVVIWASNFTVTKYLFDHGFQPLAYAAVRYGLAALLFTCLTLVLERSLAIGGRRTLALLLVAVVILWVNQISFLYALELSTASTTALIAGSIPVFTGLLASAVGLERLSARFWTAAAVSFGGVALVAIGSGGDQASDIGGVLLAVFMSATWAAYSVSITPLMRSYSPFRLSAVVLLATWLLLLLTSLGQLASQDFGELGWESWVLFAYATVGPLVITNVLWFTAIDRVGPSHASLFTNLQPFLAAVFAVIFLDEGLEALQIAGGLAIAAGILLARRRPPLPAPVE